MSGPADPVKPPPTRPKGHRPVVFDDPAIDQLHAAYVTLATELAVAFERIDTLERLLERHAGVTREEIEGFEADGAVAESRATRRTDLAQRLLRPFREFREDQIARAEHARSAPVRAPDEPSHGS
jgi:hypothetical protein